MLKKIKSLPSLQLLILLLLTDVLFMILHILHKLPFVDEWFPIFDEDAFSITRDLGMAEAFQYVQEFWIILLLAWLIVRYRKTEFSGWGLLFGFLFLDDMFSLHEKLGDFIAGLLGGSGVPLIASLEMDDIGEVIGVMAIGVLFALIIFPVYLRLKNDSKPIFRTLFWMLAGLLFFGLGIDLLDRFIESGMIQEIFKLIEDGGEMLAMSVICWYSYTLTGNAAANS